jgi:hypothetical protein
MRGLALASVTLLAACSQGEAEPGGAKPERVFCALGGSLQFADNCTIERTAVEGAQVIVVRHPDGAFRRLEVSKDGQNLTAADGAEQSQSALKGDRFEVILGDSRYVIPAKADASAQ